MVKICRFELKDVTFCRLYFWLRQELKVSQCQAQYPQEQSIFIFLGQRSIRVIQSEP